MSAQNILKIVSKVQWIISLESSWQNTFYPSLVKKIEKSDALFQNHFTIELIDLDKTKFQKIFLPMYEKLIVSRPDYKLDTKSIMEKVYQHMAEGTPYKLMALFSKKGHEYYGGIVFSVYDDHIRIANRVFDKGKIQVPKVQTSVDYWMESQLYEHAKKLEVEYIRHGTDHFPRYGKGLGLCIFKLQIGSLPRQPKDVLFTELKKDTLESRKEAVFYFENPDKKGFFKEAVLINKSEEVQNLLGTLSSLLFWAKIELKSVNSH